MEKVQAWRATSLQLPSELVYTCDERGVARVLEANLSRATSSIAALAQGDDPPALVVLPEFYFTGPPHGLSTRDWIAKACFTIPGAITAPLQEAARRHRVFIAGNQFEQDPDWPGTYFLTCFLIDDSGEVILRYKRANCAAFPSPHDLFSAYAERLTPADMFPVVDTRLGRLGMIPCSEITVPEVARVLMMQGAEVILHPTNSARRFLQEAALPVRAAENMVYIVSANVAGPIGFSADGTIPGGRSHIIDYLGRTLSYEDTDRETTDVSATIDIEALRTARATDFGTLNPLLRARWEMYRPFFAEASFYPPDQFLHVPMRDEDDARRILPTSLANMKRAGLPVRPADLRRAEPS